MAAVLSKRVFWTDSFAHPNLDGDLAKSTAQQNPNLIYASAPSLIVSHFSMQTEKPPFDDLRVRQALSEAIRRESIAELGNQAGAVGTGVYPLGPWAMPVEMRQQLIGYGPDMARRIAHAKELLAAYEKEKGKVDWSKIKIQCSTNIKFSCEMPRWCSSYSRRSMSTLRSSRCSSAASRQRGVRQLHFLCWALLWISMTRAIPSANGL